MDGAIIRQRNERALTLLEAIIAIGLLALATLSLLTVIVGGMKLMQRSNEMAAANDVAKSTLEAVKRDFRLHKMDSLPPAVYKFDGRVPDDAVDMGPTLNTFPPAPYPDITVGGRQYFVVVEGLNEGTRVRRVKVSVYWDDDTPVVLETLLHP
jgi:type II secretory pathway pseudopilin PulG